MPQDIDTSQPGDEARELLTAAFGQSQLDRLERIALADPERQQRIERERAKTDFFDELASED